MGLYLGRQIGEKDSDVLHEAHVTRLQLHKQVQPQSSMGQD